MAIGNLVKEYRLEVTRTVQPVRRRLRLITEADGGTPGPKFLVEFRDAMELGCKVTDNSGTGGEVEVAVPFSGFATVMHLLRSERPIRVVFGSGDPGLLILSAAGEPPGEGAGDGSPA